MTRNGIPDSVFGGAWWSPSVTNATKFSSRTHSQSPFFKVGSWLVQCGGGCAPLWQRGVTGGFDLPISNQLGLLSLNPLQQLTGRLIIRILWHQLAAHGQFQNQLTQFLDAIHADAIIAATTTA